MIVGPIATEIGPTAGGTNVMSMGADPIGATPIGEVAALAPAVPVPMASRLLAAATVARPRSQVVQQADVDRREHGQ